MVVGWCRCVFPLSFCQCIIKQERRRCDSSPGGEHSLTSARLISAAVFPSGAHTHTHTLNSLLHHPLSPFLPTACPILTQTQLGGAGAERGRV